MSFIRIFTVASAFVVGRVLAKPFLFLGWFLVEPISVWFCWIRFWLCLFWCALFVFGLSFFVFGFIVLFLVTLIFVFWGIFG